MVVREKTEQEYLETLKRHFHVLPFEKHPDAIITLIFNKAIQKFLGNKKRVTKRGVQRIKEYIRTRLRAKYGEYANITNFRMKNLAEAKYITNFHLMFNVRDLGALYALPFSVFGRGLLFTTHSFKRLEERASPLLLNVVREITKAEIQEKPTAADLTQILVSRCGLEYGRWRRFYFLNVNVGKFVLERYENIFIAKTFLSDDMIHDGIRWYAPLLSEEQLALMHSNFDTFNEFVDADCVKVQKPVDLSSEEVISAIFS